MYKIRIIHSKCLSGSSFCLPLSLLVEKAEEAEGAEGAESGRL